jgi:hypothetical protein
MTSVAFPKSIFSELAADLPRHVCRTGESITMSSKGRTWIGFRSVVPGIALLLMVTVAGAGNAMAATTGAGGTCPTGANYWNTATNTLVTLSSLGVTSCYFVAANGSEGNTGTDETNPWLYAPMMPNSTHSAVLGAGIGIILRGGDTWHEGNSGASPYTGGSWNFNSGAFPTGSGGSPIYVGVDQTWFTGGAWARPIVTGDNATTTSESLSSCTYNSSTLGFLINIAGAKYYYFDNLELTGFCQQDFNVTNGEGYFNYGSSTGPQYMVNNYIHGWSHQAFGNPHDPIASCGVSGPCFNVYAFYGSTVSGTHGDTALYNVVDGSDSDPFGAGACYCGVYNWAYNYFGNQAQMIDRDLHVYHDNITEFNYDMGHSNTLESAGLDPGSSVLYNNIFRHINPSPGNPGTVNVWVAPPSGSTSYFFNNLLYDFPQSMNTYVAVAASAHNAATGPLIAFNNTIQTQQSQSIFSCGGGGQSFSLTVANNFVIGGTGVVDTSCTSGGSLTQVTNITMTNAAATSAGYTSGEIFAFSPPSGGSATVGTGTNETSGYCATLLASGDPLMQAAGTACKLDTTYGCTYNTTPHTLSCPARTAVSRPSNSAWDAGMHQYNLQNPPPSPPTGLSGVVH